MDLQIRDRVALVSGGSQGIGEAVARRLAAEGARVAITYRKERARAEAIVADLERAGGAALALPMELGDLRTVDAVADAVLARWGRIDILVNNAVMWSDRPLGQMPPFEDVARGEWLTMLRANLEPTYALTQRAVPSMRAQKWGRIVNLSSGVALDGVVGGGPYAAAKLGVVGLTHVLARELGPHGILANVVVPGFTLTERMVATAPPGLREQRAQSYPIKRLLGPDEVAPTIVFLASGLNSAVTGETIRASGGRPLW